MGDSLLRRPELKRFRFSSAAARHDCFQMRETLFNTLVESLQENPGQEPNRIRGTKVEWALPDSVDRFF
jgi:hypothetical protein